MTCNSGGMLKYSSVTAFIAHYRALRDAAENAAPLSAHERGCLQEMEALLRSALSQSEREALDVSPEARLRPGRASAAKGAAGSQAERRRARAELRLHHALAARGILVG